MKYAAFALLFAVSAANAGFACKPSTFGGTGTKFVRHESAVGFSVGWLCPQGTDGNVMLYQYWGHWSELPAAWWDAGMSALDGGTTAMDALTAKVPVAPKNAQGSSLNPADLGDVVLATWTDLQALVPTMRPAPPPTGAWKVKPNGTAATRVVFAYNATTKTRGLVTNQTVPVGTVCDQSIKVVEAIGPLVNTYMGVPGGIAVCTQ